MIEDRPPVVDIVCATYNGARHLREFVASLQAQDHPDWRLWIRDDGSTDGTPSLLQGFARADARVRVVSGSDARLGVTGSFGALLQGLGPESRYVMCADQDDVWLPHKLRTSLKRMQQAEAEAPGPVLLHTDLAVVDEALNPIAPSFWLLTRLQPEPATIPRVVLQGLVTGATVLVNRSLLDLSLPIPREAIMHDWWMACVAAGRGRVVALREPTVLYRQHGANVVGAAPPAWEGGVTELPQRVVRAMARREAARRSVDATARQAGALLARAGEGMSPADREFLEHYARIPSLGLLARKAAILRWRCRAEFGWLRNLGMLVRG